MGKRFSTRTPRPARAAPRIAGVVGLAIVVLLAVASVALADRFPPTGDFNGLIITYSVSGAQMGTPVDAGGFTTSRTVTGTLTGGRLEVSGTVEASWGWSAAVTVTVSAGENSDSFSASSPPAPNGLAEAPWSQSFSAGVDVPKGASGGSFSIVLSGEYNAGGRALAVDGTFEGSGSGGGGGSGAGTITGQGEPSEGGDIGTDEDQGPVPWKTAAGGLAAAAAAAVAMAGAARAGNKREEEPDPDKPVGYILHVSTDSLTLRRDHSVSFSAQVFQVMPDGGMEPAAANIAVTAPAGVGVESASGASPLSTAVWQAGDIAANSALLVQATAAGGGTQTAVTVAGESQLALNVVFEPTDKRRLIVGGADHVTLLATIEIPPGSAGASNLDLAQVRDSIEFSSASEWLDFSAAVTWGEGRAINVAASHPDPNHPKEPPPTCVVQVKAEVDGTVLSQNVSIEMVNPAIDAKPDIVEFAAGSGSTAKVSVWIDPPGGQWTFETAWRDGSQALARVDLEDTGPGTCTLTFTEDSAGNLDPSRPQDSATLRAIARAADSPDLERYIKVIVGQEGLFIDPIGRHPEDGSYHVLADGTGEPTEIDFRVYVRNPDGGVEPDSSLAQSLQFTPTDDLDSRSRNGAEVAELTIEPAGLRDVEPSSGTYRAGVKYPIPGDVPVLPVHFDVSVPGQTDQEKFTKSLVLGLVPSRDAPGGPDWQREYNRCLEIINDFVPLKYQGDLKRILERRSRHLGADGLYELRHRLWVIAQNLTLGEGGMGYHDEAKWANRIVTVLEYAEWAGDVAFHGATTHFIGPWAALGLAQCKQLVVSAIVAYEENLSPEDWLWQNLGVIPSILEGQVIDVDKFNKLTNNNKVKAWALFVGYHFFKNYLYNGKSFTDSLIEAGRAARDEAIAAWLGEKLRAEAAGRRPEAKRPKGADTRRPGTAKSRADDMATTIKAKTAGGEKLDADTVMEIMRDPDAMRELRKNHPDSWKKLHETRQQVYDAHDEQLKEWIKKNVPEAGGREVVIQTFGTPDGIDRDYRAGVVYTDPNTGNKTFIEIKKERWAGESQKIFAEHTGGPTDPAGAAKWSKDHQQLATDMHHGEASVDMADQATVWKPETGKWEQTQITPNVDLVKQGRSTLMDPDGLGKTYETKVAESYHAGNQLDAYKQADKAVHSLEGVREGYAHQGYGVKELPPKVEAGMQAIKDVQSGKLDPAGAEARLKELGFGDGLPEFMEKVSGQFASFKWARKG